MADTPDMIGKYKIQGQIAQGGMGAIYKSTHPELKKPVIIKKLMTRGSAMAKERFLKEAKILLEMQSPYIVRLFDYFTEAGGRFIVEEFVDGLSLDKLIKKQGSISPQVSMLVMQDSLYGLRFAHKKAVVHRDIKPGNILLSKRGEIKVTDFGIASDDSDDRTTKDGVVLGTPSYMPPEQFKNSSGVDQRADIYALGVMLYEMVTGQKPYTAETQEEMYEKARKGRFVDPRKFDKKIPPEICKLIKKMMAPKAKRRFKSVDPIIKIVKNYLKHYDAHAIRVELAKMVISPRQLKEAAYKKKRNVWKDFFVALVLCGAAAAGAWYLWTEGWVHRTVLRSIYTPVNMTIKLPQTSAPASHISARALFFTNGTEIKEVEGSARVFVEGAADKKGLTAERPASKLKAYHIKPVFLKPGMYRAKVAVGSYVWWENFEVTKEEKSIDINFSAGESRPIKLLVSARDGKNGMDLSDRAKCQILYNGRWVALEEVPREKFNSAAVWKFKVSLDGYEDELFSLLIDWYQDTVMIRAELFLKK